MDERQIRVQRAICASPGTIFEVLASPAGHVSIDASGMLMSADGDPVSAVGDRFTVQMDRDSLQDFPLGEYEVEVVITRFEVDRAIAWGIESANLQPPSATSTAMTWSRSTGAPWSPRPTTGPTSTQTGRRPSTPSSR
jgi:hypothetical protein